LTVTAAKYGFFTLFTLLFAAWMFHFFYPLWHAVQTNIVRAEQREKIKHDTNSFKHLVLSSSRFQQHYIDDEQELNIDGRMYDVVAVYHKDGMTWCTVLPDDAETELQEQLACNIHQETSMKTSKHAVYWWPLTYKNSANVICNFVFTPMSVSAPAKNVFFRPDDFTTRISQPPEIG
jgi:hypothetical protein